MALSPEVAFEQHRDRPSEPSRHERQAGRPPRIIHSAHRPRQLHARGRLHARRLHLFAHLCHELPDLVGEVLGFFPTTFECSFQADRQEMRWFFCQHFPIAVALLHNSRWGFIA